MNLDHFNCFDTTIGMKVFASKFTNTKINDKGVIYFPSLRLLRIRGEFNASQSSFADFICYSERGYRFLETQAREIKSRFHCDFLYFLEYFVNVVDDYRFCHWFYGKLSEMTIVERCFYLMSYIQDLLECGENEECYMRFYEKWLHYPNKEKPKYKRVRV